MNILILSPYPPYPPHGGGTMRIYQMIRGLASRHHITCLTFASDVQAEQAMMPLHDICRVITVNGPPRRTLARRAWTTLASSLPDMALRNASPLYQQCLTALLEQEVFEIIQAESIEMAGYLMTIRTHRSLCQLKSKLILDEFNAEYMLQRRAFLTDIQHPRRWHAALYSLAQWLKLLRYEKQALGCCDAALVVSANDQVILRSLAPSTPVATIPNGVDTNFFNPSNLELQTQLPSLRDPFMVFSGTLDFRPNIDAVLWFVQEVLGHLRRRFPNIQLLVVGKRPAPVLQQLAAAEVITLLGDVPDVRPYIAGAAVYVVPMRIGGGVRLKLLEALAMEAPVVSTSMGAEGIDGLRDTEHCLLADRAEDFAQAVAQLISDPALGRRLGRAGRALVCSGYDWNTILPRLEPFFQQVGCTFDATLHLG